VFKLYLIIKNHNKRFNIFLFYLIRQIIKYNLKSQQPQKKKNLGIVGKEIVPFAAWIGMEDTPFVLLAGGEMSH
jgi:hypothetical protein